VAYRFGRETRAELKELGHDEQMIGVLEARAARCKQDSASARRLATDDLPRAKRDLRRIHNRAAALLEAIDEAHPVVRFAVRRHRPAIETLARRGQDKGGRPKDHDRHHLEYAVGLALARRDIRLSASPKGLLARTLAVVLAAVGAAPDEDRIRQVCRRVRDQVARTTAG